MPRKRTEPTAAQELIAKELRKAIRRRPKLEQARKTLKAELDDIEGEIHDNDRAIKSYRVELGPAYDRDGKLIEDE